MKSKSKIDKQLERKTDSEIVETIISSKKNSKWLEVAGMLSGPRRKRAAVNLEKINSEAKDGEVILVPGKVLSKGELDKKLKQIISMGISESALEKLDKAKVKYVTILEEIKKNPDFKGIKIIR